MFLPATPEEIKKLGWNQPDIILVSGDAYIDSPFSGIALIGQYLMNAGFKTAVISQPSLDSATDIMKFGIPRLYWGVSAGATDSLVANYTASGKKRRSCDFTPGGLNTRRPDRATIAYTNLIKQHDRLKKPVVLGGIEASLRRFTHYDLLTEKIRRPLLLDAKADYLIYGMGEFAALALASALNENKNINNINNLCYISKEMPQEALRLPSCEEVMGNPEKFQEFFRKFYDAASTLSQQTVVQECGGRWVVQNPPHIAPPAQLDEIYELDYERAAHPSELARGEVKAVETTRWSITSHRGCYGECSFCAISVHQGRRVVSRSEESVLKEAQTLSRMPGFKGFISDVGGATANMYGTECPAMQKGKPCKDKRCLYPEVCPSLKSSQKRYVNLLKRIRALAGIKKVHVSSGIRTDLVMADTISGLDFIKELAHHHTSGQIKLAPEHIDPSVLNLMGKCGMDCFEAFTENFTAASRQAGKKQFVTCYYMAAHPGSTVKSMEKLKNYNQRLHFTPEQVQIFTPTPSTWSTCIYYTGIDPFNNTPVYVARTYKEKTAQKEMLFPFKGRKK